MIFQFWRAEEDTFNLEIHNRSSDFNTFYSSTRLINIDLTIRTASTVGKVSDWTVIEQSLSDRITIIFDTILARNVNEDGRQTKRVSILHGRKSLNADGHAYFSCKTVHTKPTYLSFQTQVVERTAQKKKVSDVREKTPLSTYEGPGTQRTTER